MKCILPSRLRQTRSLRPRRLPALLLAVAAALTAASVARAILRARQDRLHLTTGGARWIWWTYDLEQPALLRFYAEKSFPVATPPGPARARIFVDGRWELFVNGDRLASGDQRAGNRLVAVDATGRLRAGENRIVIAVESATGAGGILFSLDLGQRSNAVVSDSSWRVSLSEAEAREGRGRPAVVWGKPPMHPWGYP